MTKRTNNDWSTIFRGLGNPNRLRVLKILSKTKEMSVSSLSEELRISFKNTSRNLSILLNLGLVEFQGKKDRVYYTLSRHLEDDIRQILKVTF